jgi:hypothetical protein
MLQRRLIALCSGLLFFLTIQAQVNLQTGSANFSLPMFNWQDSKSRLNLAVALSYNSGNGLKVSDVASNVGQGWNLVAGGVIARMPVGEPDDQKAFGNVTEHDIKKYPDGFLHTTISPGKGCSPYLAKYPIYGAKNEVYRQHNSVAADKQLDYFSYQFNGKAGMFVLDPVNGNNCAALGDTKMKITFEHDVVGMQNQGNRTTIKSFAIQDVDGLIYRFRVRGRNKVLEANYCDKSLTQAQTQPNFKSGGIYHQAGFENANFVRPWVVGNWYLAEIEDAFTHRKITFEYGITVTINNVAGTDIAYDSWHNYLTLTHKSSLAEVPVLTAINCPDGHKVTLRYDKNRVDLSGDKALTAVDVTYTTNNKINLPETRYLSKHLINTSYFILNRYGTPSSTYEKKMARLCLRSVKKIGPDLKEDSPPYIFDYNMGTDPIEGFVPPPFCVSHDIWGYYNGFNSTGYANEGILPISPVSSLNFNQLRGLCFMRNGVSGIFLNAKPGYAKNGLLKQIIYPTGGTLSYEYEQNTGVLNGATTNVGGVHVSKTKSTDGGYSNDCNNPITTQYNYVMNGPGSASSLWGLEMPDNTGEMSMHYAPEKRNYRWNPFKCHGGLAGCCYWAFQYPGIMSQTQSIDLTGFQKFMINAEPVLSVLSTVMTICDIIIVASGSTGVGAIVALVVDVIATFLEVGLSCTSDDSKDGTSVSYYSYDLNGVSPLPAQFKRVEIVEGSGTNGKKVVTFTSSDDYEIWAPDNPNQTAKQRFAPWAYGLPKLTTDYDASGVKVKETENVYDFNYAQSIIEFTCWHCPPPENGVYSNLVSCKCLIKKNSSQRYTDWTDPAKYDDLSIYQKNSDENIGVEFYPMYTGRTELQTTYERVYKPNDASQYVQTQRQYRYNLGTPNYEAYEVSEKQSNGDWTYKYIKYSGDFAGGIFDVMKNNNMVSVPVSTNEMVSGPTSSGYINQEVTEFTQVCIDNATPQCNFDIKPLRTLVERTDRPTNTWAFYNGLSTDYTKFKITELFSYDAVGNLITAKDEGNRSVATIYDYADKYVVAKVINADATIDKPAYTSFETGSFGGWQPAETANYTSSAVTGNSSLNLAGNSLTATLNTTKPYILSFWASSNITVSGGATLVKSAPVINGFTYYEYNIAAGTGSVTVSGSAIIDELRVYPKTARMSTTTYDPLTGKTSECDENNRCTYYEYDNLARLRFIKDENRNIVKMYEYNNVSKQNGCPGIYYNPQIVEYFTKSNCVGDYIGAEVPYTVPANKYSSTFSQEDADLKAEMEIAANGQDNADQSSSSTNCIPLYFNAAHSQDFETQTCPEGYYGGNVTYTVPARKYSSTVAGEAEQWALDEIAANGQAYANSQAHANCILNTYPEWEMIENGYSYCVNVNGQTPGHLFVEARDVNPNSSSYNSISYQDFGVSDQCPGFYNTDQSDYYYSQTCPAGPSYGTAYYVSVPLSTFSSNVSLEDANNQARQWAQEQANMYGGCNVAMIHLDYSSNAPDWIRIELQSTSDPNGYYYFEIPSGNPNYASGYWSIPAGYYNVTFTPYNMSSWYYHDYVTCGDDNYKWNMWDPWTFNNVLFNDDCHSVTVGTNY